MTGTITIEVQSHNYECTATDPTTCPAAHWDWSQIAPNLDEAIEWGREDDSPFCRVVVIDEDGNEEIAWSQVAWKPLRED